MRRRVVYRPRAAEDLDRIYDWIADFAGPDSAKRIVDGITKRCDSLRENPQRCRPRPELGEGIRTTVTGKAVIAIRVQGKDVEIVRVRYAGQQVLASDME